jgi:precorrin-6B methylase 2
MLFPRPERYREGSAASVICASFQWLIGEKVHIYIYRAGPPVADTHQRRQVMISKERISLITHSCASIGAVETFKALVRYAFRSKIADSNYDRRNSTDTARRIANEKLEMSDPEAQSHATCYRTASERFIGYLISHLGINYPEYDFVDIGCGKGRVLLVASKFPFRSIYGIELSQAAFEIAEKNIRTYRCADQKCFNIHIRNVDARSFEPYVANTVYYFLEPFDTVILTAVLAKLSSKMRGHGKIIYVVCIWSDLAAVIKLFEMLGFQTIRTQKMLITSLNYAIFSLR